VEAELNIGVRERDLRLWLSQVQQDSKQVGVIKTIIKYRITNVSWQNIEWCTASKNLLDHLLRKNWKNASFQLMDLCLRPMAFRPPYFGGNRLGILLMELRREFILAGVFPHQLPELAQPSVFCC
jgi:hypothetical protein